MSESSAYLAETARVIQATSETDLEAVATAFEQAWDEGRRIFICGNGGSGSLAAHLACDYNKNCNSATSARFKIISLADNLPTILAYANDLSYDEVFVEQLKNLFEPGDLVVGVSGSGNSENVVRTLRWAREHGGRTLGFIGFGGGRLKDVCDVFLIADTHDMQHCEDAHVVWMHLLMQRFMKRATDVG